MSKLLIGLIGAAVIGSGGYAAASGIDDSSPARTVSIPAAPSVGGTTTTGTTTAAGTVEDVSGPCDEAEHANDPRCTGAATPPPAATAAAPTTTAENEVEDVSGPCDEAEHANDPRCAGGSTARANDDDNHNHDDRSGHGREDDRSGSNSGKG